MIDLLHPVFLDDPALAEAIRDNWQERIAIIEADGIDSAAAEDIALQQVRDEIRSFRP